MKCRQTAYKLVTQKADLFANPTLNALLNSDNCADMIVSSRRASKATILKLAENSARAFSCVARCRCRCALSSPLFALTDCDYSAALAFLYASQPALNSRAHHTNRIDRISMVQQHVKAESKPKKKWLQKNAANERARNFSLDYRCFLTFT